MQLIPENETRKIDNIGRITLPMGLRKRFNLNPNDPIELYTASIDGHTCICLMKAISPEEEVKNSLKILSANGIHLSDEQEALLQEE